MDFVSLSETVSSQWLMEKDIDIYTHLSNVISVHV